MKNRPFTTGHIDGVVLKGLKKYIDERGWLCELFRQDEMDESYYPVMSYLSMSEPGIVRGPHEHVDQADFFVFLGPGNFKITLWDNRKSSKTYWNKTELIVGEDHPKSVLVPPGVVHAYQNISKHDGVVLNFPNQLFMGEGKKFPADEIRHETMADSVFRL